MKMRRRNFLYAVGIVLGIITVLRIWKTHPTNALKETAEKKEVQRNLIVLSKVSASSIKNNGTRPVGRSNPHSLSMLHKKWTSKLQCNNDTLGYDADVTVLTGINNAQRTGYVLVLKFNEQLTKASENLFSLQCWAKTLFVNIVEPFLMNSYFVVPLDETQKDLLSFRDIFDIKVWSLLSAKHTFAPLATWNDFVKKAPRLLIVVRFKYITSSEYKKRRDSHDKMTHLAVNTEYKTGCPRISPELSGKIDYLRTRHNFTVIREVCFNFAQGDELTLLQFNRHIYRGLGPKTVSVLMEEWKGFTSSENGKHVSLFDACWLPTVVHPISYKWPSQKLICDAKKYKQRYLNGQDYITLMVRTEKIERLISTGDINSMSKCLNQTLKRWRKLIVYKGINQTFLSMDIGKYGSYSLMEKKNDLKYHPYMHLYEAFIKELFGRYATVRSWELGFEMVTSSHDSGYIGSLQKTIATESNCIVFTGGGSFQKHTKYIHERINKLGKCNVIVHECSRGL